MQQKQGRPAALDAALTAVFELLSGEAAIIQSNGEIIAGNLRFACRFGMTPSACIGRNIHDLLEASEGTDASSCRESMRARCDEVIRTGVPVAFEACIDGRMISTVIDPVGASACVPSQLIIRFQELAEVPVVDRMASHAKDVSELALSLSHTGIWMLDIGSGTCTWSETTWALFGRTPGIVEASSGLWLSMIHPDDRETVRRVVESAIKKETEIDLEYRLLLQDESVRWCQTRGMPRRDGTGKAVSYLGTVADVTARKLAESALKESEARFRSLFENHAAPMLIIDSQTGRIVDANPAASAFYGWTRTELGGMLISNINLMPPDELHKAMERSRKAQQVQFRFRHRMANGSIRDVDVFSTRVVIDRKELLYSIVHDVTEKLRTERKLNESEALFRSLFEDHCAVMIILDPETGEIVDANQAATEFYGWSRSELSMMNITQINCADPDLVRSDIRAWGQLNHRYIVARHQRADGSIRDVEIFAKKVDVNGRIRIYDIIHDITERTRLEALAAIRVNLLEKNDALSVPELLQATLDEIERVTGSQIAFCFVIAKDQQLLSLQAVSTATSIVMSGMSETLGHCPLDRAGVWADAFRERRTVIYNDYASLGHRKGLPEGHVGIRRLMVVPVIRGELVVAAVGIGNKRFDYDEDDARWVAAVADQVWDIIEKKTTEAEYRRMEERLQHSQKMELVGQLASGIAHEINNPLNFIQLNLATQQEIYADMLRLFNGYRSLAYRNERHAAGWPAALQNMQRLAEELDIDSIIADMQRMFVESQRGVDRIKHIVEGMKSLSYRHDPENKTLSDLNKGVFDSLTMARGEYRYCADIETHLEKLPLVPCILDQINQVLLNLIVNSAHAIQSQHRASKGRISIRTWSDNGRVYCSITDDGPGIPEENRAHIFNPFFTTKSAGKGTGLGLSISYDIIVNKHDGEISVHCLPEGGAVFTFSIPLSNPEASEVAT